MTLRELRLQLKRLRALESKLKVPWAVFKEADLIVTLHLKHCVRRGGVSKANRKDSILNILVRRLRAALNRLQQAEQHLREELTEFRNTCLCLCKQLVGILPAHRKIREAMLFRSKLLAIHQKLNACLQRRLLLNAEIESTGLR